MPFIDTNALEVIERQPGWQGLYFHSPSMTFAHYDFKRGSSIHEHFHPQEEVYEVIEGELELTIEGMSRVRPECPDPDPSDRSVAADVLLRQEPDEDEDEEEDGGDGKEDDDDDDNDDGYSE